MRTWNFLLHLVAVTGSFILAASAINVLSYAPFLALTPDSNNFVEYRSPTFYRPAEWVILRTPLQPLLLEWAEWHNVRRTTEMQVFFYCDGISNPKAEIDWNRN